MKTQLFDAKDMIGKTIDKISFDNIDDEIVLSFTDDTFIVIYSSAEGGGCSIMDIYRKHLEYDTINFDH